MELEMHGGTYNWGPGSLSYWRWWWRTSYFWAAAKDRWVDLIVWTCCCLFVLCKRVPVSKHCSWVHAVIYFSNGPLLFRRIIHCHLSWFVPIPLLFTLTLQLYTTMIPSNWFTQFSSTFYPDNTRNFKGICAVNYETQWRKTKQKISSVSLFYKLKALLFKRHWF